MTDDLPRGELTPLPPPDGAFETVSRRAAHRRLRRGAVAGALSLALVAGAFVVGTTLVGTSDPDALVVASPEPSSAASTGPSAGPSTAPSPSGPASTEPSVPPSPTASAAPSPSPSPEPPTTYTGKVVTADGAPVGGAWLITLDGPTLRAARLAGDGTWTSPCDGLPQVVAMWDLRSQRQPRDMRNLAITPVPRVTCEQADEPVVTVMREGGTVTGRLVNAQPDEPYRSFDDGADPGGGLYCPPAMGFPADGPQCARWESVRGEYRFTGLATGTYRLQGMYGGQEVEVVAGRTTRLDWYECPPACAGRPPQPTAEDTQEPSPLPSPS